MAVTAGLSLLMLMTLPVAAQIRTVYFDNDGGTLTLNPNFPQAIKNITWKYKGNLLVEFSTELGYLPLEYEGEFKHRGNLNRTSGSLMIIAMKQSYGGLFTVEINVGVAPVSFNAVGINNLAGYPVEVFVMPKGCSRRTSKNCTLVCGEEFEGAEPVRYFWKAGKTGEWNMGNKTLSIVFTKNTKDLSDYACKVKNPVSEKRSDIEADKKEKLTPLDSSSGPDPMPAILLVAVLAVGAAVVV